MMSDTRMTINWGSAVLFAAAFLTAGATATFVFMRNDAGSGGHAAGAATPSNAQPSPAAPAVSRTTSLPDVVVPLSQDAVKRAGIEVAPVATGSSVTKIRLPGVVEPNAYRQ